MLEVDLAVAEMAFARKELSFKGGFIRPNPYNSKMINHPDYEPFWAAAEDLDFSVGFHEAAAEIYDRASQAAGTPASRRPAPEPPASTLDTVISGLM